MPKYIKESYDMEWVFLLRPLVLGGKRKFQLFQEQKPLPIIDLSFVRVSPFFVQATRINRSVSRWLHGMASIDWYVCNQFNHIFKWTHWLFPVRSFFMDLNVQFYSVYHKSVDIFVTLRLLFRFSLYSFRLKEKGLSFYCSF